jgi:HK97 family phage major capsid protein
MKSKDLINEARQKFSEAFMQSIKDGDEVKMADAVAELSQQIQDALMQDAHDASADKEVLAARGVRVLTSSETKYYDALIKAMSSASNIKAAVENIDVTMPETIIDAVMDDIQTAFPLLDEIDFRNTTAITKWFYNKQGVQQAAWGKLDTKITQELSGAIGDINLTQCKLTGYMVVSKDFLKLDRHGLTLM